MAMVYLPAGEFLMGTREDDPLGLSDSEPQHTVFLSAYWIYQTEVTTALYAVCVTAGVCEAPIMDGSWSRQVYYGNPEYANFPMIEVDWSNAQSYCQWAGGKLPTEAEWEKAARGTDGRSFPWGNEITCNQANAGMIGCSLAGDTAPVGSYPEDISPYGVYDMAGNVNEWVADW
jgi:formylglycine-generating enzyme required for sulfatase activity